mgnify:CR=1 FL=1
MRSHALLYTLDMTPRRGFTLIELLVVIAIIGILSSVVLASLSAARSRAADASVKANLATVRTQASLYYDLQGRYGSITGTYYVGDCMTSGTMFRETSITGEARAAADSITNAIAKAYADGNGTKECRIDGPRSQYLIAIGLKSTNTYWCIDHTGKAKDIGTSTPAAGVLECP